MESQIETLLKRYLSEQQRAGVVLALKRRARWDGGAITEADAKTLSKELRLLLPSYLADAASVNRCVAELEGILQHRPDPNRIITIPVNGEMDVIRARVEASDLCRTLGYSAIDQMRVATSVSELARNIANYAGSGEVRMRQVVNPINKQKGVEFVAKDSGPGILILDSIMAGTYKSKRGMGMGLLGVKRLMDEFDIKTGPGQGTVVRIVKYLHAA